MMCLSVVLFGSNLFGPLCASWTCMSISFVKLGKFSFIIFSFLSFFDIFIDYAITVVPFPPLHSTPSYPPPPSHIPPYSSCPWVLHMSSLASTFPILFLPSPCLFSTYHLCYLFSVPCLLYTSDAADEPCGV